MEGKNFDFIVGLKIGLLITTLMFLVFHLFNYVFKVPADLVYVYSVIAPMLVFVILDLLE